MHPSVRSPRLLHISGRTSAALFAAILSLPAYAQTNAAPAPASASAIRTTDEVVVLEKIEVTETREDALAPLTAGAAAQKLATVAGGTSLIDNSLVERGRVATSADILAFTPGIFASPPAGTGDGIKISARGSGIARSAGNFFRNGVLFSFDGLPVTGPGGTPYELFETYGLDYTEVQLGGNGFDAGALQLGGSINYVSLTGYDASPFEARVDVGSFGYRKYQASSGQVVGNLDYYASVVSFQADGQQANARGESDGVAGNLGYRVSTVAETRFFLRHRQTYNQNPGTISLNELERDESTANPDNVVGRVDRDQPGSTWIANRTRVQITPDSGLELGLVHHNAPIDIAPTPSPGTAASATANRERSLWNFRDLTGQAKYTREDTLFGLESRSTAAIVYSYEYDADVNTYANNPNVVAGVRRFGNLLKTANYNNSADASFRLGNELGLTEKLQLNTGAALVYIRRAGEITFARPGLAPAAPAPGALGAVIDRDNHYFAPRAGVLYKLQPETQLFANVTRSIEGPNSWQLSRGSNGNYFNHDDIRDQQAWAYEVGARTRQGPVSGSLSLFHSDVKDELLTVPIDPSNLAAGNYTFNGSDTFKQGVELGLDVVLWSEEGVLHRAADEKATRVTLRQTYGLNDFGYKGDVSFGENELPGIPRQLYQAQLAFDHSSGFYASATLTHGSSYYVDFANTLEAPAYTTYGLGVGYNDPKDRWSVYLDARNITDEQYAASANPTFNAAGSADNRLFQAADGFGVYGGITVRF